ncbi:MAG: glucose dehydrogenase [Acidimicrobiia bacterium]|nr:glucose dehydrogenase [Acidimicrobiia bacterium]
MRRRLASTVVVLALIAAACGGDTAPVTVPTTDVTPSTLATTTTTAETPTTTADEPTTTTSPASTTTDGTSTTTGGSTTTSEASTTTSEASTTTTTTTSATTTTAATTTTTTTVPETVLTWTEVAEGFGQPVFVTAPPGDSRLFVVDQPGRIWVIDGGDPEVFLDVRSITTYGGERGLLGMAFHPDDPNTFYINHVSAGDTVVAEYRVSGNVADTGSRRVLLTVDQPATNHNGGMIAFGPDGYLWIGMGDGGGSNDKFGQGQRADTLLGSMLRIDVDGDPYVVPSNNPYSDGVDGAPEVWAIGLRNPWRFAFDNGLVYIADVGQGAVEEVSIAPASAAGLNYGWPIYEGDRCFDGPCDTEGTVMPAVSYPHSEGCSITGGYVYRGSALPGLVGHYFYSDYCTGFLRSYKSGSTFDWTDETGSIGAPTSFGLDGFGELYLTSKAGSVYLLTEG